MTEGEKESQRIYLQSEKGKEFKAKANKRYFQSEKGRKAMERAYEKASQKEGYKERRREYQKRYRQQLKEQVFNHYGSGCACCGETASEFLTIDHTNGGGCAHRRIVAPAEFYRWLIANNYPEGFRVLCMNCNFAIGKFGYCPHKTENKTEAISVR